MAKGGLILHGEQEFIYHRPVQVGDVLVSEGKITDAYQKESKGRTMTFIVQETNWSDDKTGEPVVTARFNLIHRCRREVRRGSGAVQRLAIGVRAPTWLTAAEWLAVLRIGLACGGSRASGTRTRPPGSSGVPASAWGQSVAEKHKWPFVKKGFDCDRGAASEGDGLRRRAGRGGHRPGPDLRVPDAGRGDSPGSC